MIARRHFWIFLFALLLPCAQMAAAAHEVSHIRTALETGSPHGGHGEICTVAAHFSGGAAANPPADIEHPELRQVTPIWRLHGQPSIGVNVPFDSRAPPNSLLA